MRRAYWFPVCHDISHRLVDKLDRNSLNTLGEMIGWECVYWAWWLRYTLTLKSCNVFIQTAIHSLPMYGWNHWSFHLCVFTGLVTFYTLTNNVWRELIILSHAVTSESLLHCQAVHMFVSLSITLYVPAYSRLYMFSLDCFRMRKESCWLLAQDPPTQIVHFDTVKSRKFVNQSKFKVHVCLTVSTNIDYQRLNRILV